MNTVALDKFLAHHSRSCGVHIYSGDRHCTCGRDAAELEMLALKAENLGYWSVTRLDGPEDADRPLLVEVA
jgi:hypothetical protein